MGKGCVGEYHSPGTLPCGTRRSSMGHTGNPLVQVENEGKRRLGYLRQCLDLLFIDGDIHHELWDYDIPAAPILVDITVDGEEDQGPRAG